MQRKPHISIFTFFMLVNYKTANCLTTVAAYKSEPSVQKNVLILEIFLWEHEHWILFLFYSLLSFCFSLHELKRELTKKYFIAAFYEKKPEILFFRVWKIYVPWIIKWKKVICPFCIFKQKVVYRCNEDYVLTNALSNLFLYQKNETWLL